MTGTVHAGLAVEALVFVAAVFLVRWAVTGADPKPRPARPTRPAVEWVPAYEWIPAQELAVPCPDCGTHITVHAASGGAL
jgi:hypothetical protein